jgi:hydroxypyruvate isomerase
MNRKDALRLLAASAALPAFSWTPSVASSTEPWKDRINQSICQWCFGDIPLEELCEMAAELGYGSVELLGPKDWPTLKKYGLTCAMAYGSDIGLNRGFNDPSLHDELKRQYMESLPKAEEFGLKQVICFSGNRNGLTDDVGMENCARGLEPIVKEAEKRGIVISMELLNSKVDHKDYQCDRTHWGVELVEKVGSPNFKLLYDIYHMQVQEGDVIATIKKNHEYISHFHTAGVPGRHEINNSQELNYSAIMTAIADTGFDGFIGQEFIPTYDSKKMALKEAYGICDV